MLYQIAHFLRDKCPFIWDFTNVVNALLFKVRYGKRLKKIHEVLENHSGVFRYRSIATLNTADLVDFFNMQPMEAFKHFQPHGFDFKAISKLQDNASFLAYAALDGDKIVGYFFLRSFVWGKTYIGRMVDVNYRGRGIAKEMNRITNDLAVLLSMRVFQTISPENISSMKSAQAVNELKIIKTLSNGDLLIENLPRKN